MIFFFATKIPSFTSAALIPTHGIWHVKWIHDLFQNKTEHAVAFLKPSMVRPGKASSFFLHSQSNQWVSFVLCHSSIILLLLCHSNWNSITRNVWCWLWAILKAFFARLLPPSSEKLGLTRSWWRWSSTAPNSARKTKRKAWILARSPRMNSYGWWRSATLYDRNPPYYMLTIVLSASASLLTPTLSPKNLIFLCHA